MDASGPGPQWFRIRGVNPSLNALQGIGSTGLKEKGGMNCIHVFRGGEKHRFQARIFPGEQQDPTHPLLRPDAQQQGPAGVRLYPENLWLRQGPHQTKRAVRLLLGQGHQVYPRRDQDLFENAYPAVRGSNRLQNRGAAQCRFFDRRCPVRLAAVHRTLQLQHTILFISGEPEPAAQTDPVALLRNVRPSCRGIRFCKPVL